MPDRTKRQTTAGMFSLDDFLHGRPDRILHATKSPRILIVWQHGNEELGPRVAHHIYTSRPDLAGYVDYVCGDPHGAATQSPAAVLGYDINRSYSPADGQIDYAQQRAKEILGIVAADSYDYVLDLHTSISQLPQFFIVRNDLPQATKDAIAASPTTRVVVMPDFITRKTLIGRNDRAVAFECNEKFAETPEATQEIIAMIEILVGLKPSTPLPREIFYVERLVPKTEDPGEDAENFELCKDGYYPIILGKGKHSYRNDPTKDYACFAARHKEDIVL